MQNKKKIILIIIIALLFVMSITLVVLKRTGVIDRIIDNNNKEEIVKQISYEVYKHVNGKTAMLVIAEDTENGIEKIIYPNNEMELYCNGKTKVAFDYNTDITGKESLTFKAINTKGEEIERTIQINNQFYLDMIDYNLTRETETQQALTVNYKAGSAVKQYMIGDSSAWVNYTNIIRLDDYQILEALGNRDVKVALRQVDSIGNEIIINVEHTILDTVTYKQENTVIEGESILACVENNNLESGNYIFRITYNGEGNTIDYPVELYNYNEDANYEASNEIVIGNTKYTGTGKTNSEKRMLILKYNGDLTINSGVTISPTGTSATINGVAYLCTKKGMFIYCAGTLTNNGNITMTAKGTVNQTGENVYLHKNEDNTYEYVPAIGGAGGAGVVNKTANNGVAGTARRTGGGGAGAGINRASKAGGSGTSYSGGVGSGGADDIAGVNVSSNGGAGGDGKGSSKNYDSAGGGAGNPGGTGFGGRYYGNNGATGTGGLLTIIANSIKNNGTITSNGSNGGSAKSAGGGASGGGSINIFYKSNITRGYINVNGGSGGPGGISGNIKFNGGNGGTGCITIGNISTGTFVKDN